MAREFPGRLDTLLTGAVIHRVPGERAAGDAVGIAGGNVVAVGSADRLEAMADARTERIELGGRTVLPAFIDSHTHFHRGSVLRRLYLDFETLRPAAIDDVLVAVAARAAELAPGRWIQGDGLSAPRLAERRLPDRHDLDRVAPTHPVVLRGIGKHVVAANSVALAAAGIDRATPDPPGGRIERDEAGDPTGILHERAKLRLDQSDRATVVPRPTTDERAAALEAGFAELHRVGITTIHEMVRMPEEADDYAALHSRGRLGARVRLFYRVHESPLSLDWLIGLGIRRGMGDDWLRILGVKVSVDGFCIFRNAAVHEPYVGEPDNCGLLRIDPEQLRELVARANAQGLTVAVHAVGARAVDVALDAFHAAGPAVAGPHRLEHAYVDVDSARLDRARRLGLAWSTQPAFLAAYAREWADAFAPSRVERFLPLRTGLDAGLPLLLNSDYPCVSLDPLDGIRAAVTRCSDGQISGGGESIPLRAAWRAYTTTPATLAGDTGLGRIEPGSTADLVVLDADPFTAGTDPASLSVRATMMAGRLVYGEAEVRG